MGREGTAIGQFRLERLLGHGGMGAVYTAIDEMTGREVAVKLLRPDLLDQSDFVDRFKAEARTLARLDHPRIARLFGFFAHGDDLLMVMEYVRGATLSALLRERGALPPETVVAWAGDMFEALHYAHEQGVVHRDVKPANIIIDEQNRARLTDFGIARTLGDSRLTQTGHAVGTIAYMSPEQVMGGQIDGRADLYAAAIVVFEMLTGDIPYTATTTFTLMREVSEGVRPAALDALPPAAAVLRPVLAKALSPSPDARYPDGASLRDALAAALRGESPADQHVVAPVTGAARGGDPRNGTTITAGVATPHLPAGEAVSRGWPSRAVLGGGVLTLGALVVAGVLWARSPSPPAGGVTPTEPPAGSEVTGEAQSAAPATPVQHMVVPDASAVPGPVLPAGPGPVSPPPAKTVSMPPAKGSAVTSGAPARVAASSPVGEAGTEDGDPAPPTRSAGAANLAPAEFTRALMMVPLEDDDTDEVEVVLRFDSRRLVVANAETRVPLRTIGYGSVSSASYSEVPSRLRAFGRGPAYWLDLTVGREHVVLRLDKRNSGEIIDALEARAGLNVQRVTRR
jgi:eukaryotic-like serine/threonine-protein kinase